MDGDTGGQIWGGGILDARLNIIYGISVRGLEEGFTRQNNSVL